MALYGAFDQTKHLEELDTPLVAQDGVLTPATRKARVLANLGITAEGWDPDLDDTQTDTLTVEEYIAHSVATVAAAGSDQAGGTLIAVDINIVTAADGAKGVRLPTAVAGRKITVMNNVGTADLLVYPFLGDDINALADNVAVRVKADGAAVFYALDASSWWCGPDNLHGHETRAVSADSTPVALAFAEGVYLVSYTTKKRREHRTLPRRQLH